MYVLAEGGDERRRKCAFAEKPAEKVGNSEGEDECVPSYAEKSGAEHVTDKTQYPTEQYTSANYPG